MNLTRSLPAHRPQTPGLATTSDIFSPLQARSYRRRILDEDRSRRAPLPVERPKNLMLRSFPAETLRVIGPFLKPVELAKQQYLFFEGDALNFIYFPGTAVISEFKMLEDGRMVEIALTGRDGAVGLSAFLLRSHSAQNITQVSHAGTAGRIPVGALTALLYPNEQLRASLNQFVDRYIRQISQKAICNMYHSVKQRLCTWLLMAQDRCGLDTLDITHDQIGRILGAYRPSVTCIAQELRSDKLIDYSRSKILICDRDLLERSACSCYLATVSAPMK